MSNSPIGNTNNQAYPQNLSPNAVSINIFNPSAFGQGVNPSAQNPIQQDNFYSLYGQNTNPNAQLYPQNYNNMVQYNPYQYNLPQQNPAQNQNPSQTSLDNSSNMAQNPSKIEKTIKEEPADTLTLANTLTLAECEAFLTKQLTEGNVLILIGSNQALEAI